MRALRALITSMLWLWARREQQRLQQHKEALEMDVRATRYTGHLRIGDGEERDTNLD